MTERNKRKEKRNEKNKTNGRKKKSIYEYNYMLHINGSNAKDNFK